MNHSDGGKGSDRRPGQGYGEGWDRIFGRKPSPEKEPFQPDGGEPIPAKPDRHPEPTS